MLTCGHCGKQLAGQYYHRGIIVVRDIDGDLHWKTHKRFCDEDCLFKYLSSKQTEVTVHAEDPA